MRAELVWNQDNHVIAIFEVEEHNEYHSVSGNIFKVTSWDIEGAVGDTEFFANASVKSDGCSHFRFLGENHVPSEEDANPTLVGYYHICGIHSYVEFMVTLLFAYEVMTHFVEQIDEVEELEQVRKMGILNAYSIVIHDVKPAKGEDH